MASTEADADSSARTGVREKDPTSMRFLRDLSLSAVNAGAVTVLVGFTSSAAIVFQAAKAVGATPEQVASWMLALGVGMGATCVALSLRYRAPIATAWSTSGAAMLITSAAGVSLEEATFAFIVAGLLTAVSGFSGAFERIINCVPMSIASGMLSGVLLRFGLDAFTSLQTRLCLIVAMFTSYLVARRIVPRYTVMLALFVGVIVAASQDLLEVGQIRFQLAAPVFVAPKVSLKALVGVALPLFVVTMASQNVPAVAVLRAGGYWVPVSPLIGWTGVATVLLAPFGAFALNLATITAAICVGPEAHEDPRKRYVAAVAAGVFYAGLGLMGATVGAAFAAFPKELVLGIAGLALLGTIGNGLSTALKHEGEREPGLITFLATASGVQLFGIGSAFWGLVGGVLALAAARAPALLRASDRSSNAIKPRAE